MATNTNVKKQIRHCLREKRPPTFCADAVSLQKDHVERADPLHVFQFNTGVSACAWRDFAVAGYNQPNKNTQITGRGS
jgi:hypothetical protein